VIEYDFNETMLLMLVESDPDVFILIVECVSNILARIDMKHLPHPTIKHPTAGRLLTGLGGKAAAQRAQRLLSLLPVGTSSYRMIFLSSEVLVGGNNMKWKCCCRSAKVKRQSSLCRSRQIHKTVG
jgi:hypothetical protein